MVAKPQSPLHNQTSSDKTTSANIPVVKNTEVLRVAPQSPTDGRFTGHFFDKTPSAAAARRSYVKALAFGTLMISILVFSVFPIYWGAVWKIPVYPLNAWVVDFDGGSVGDFVLDTLLANSTNVLSWSEPPVHEFPNGTAQLANAIVEQKAWLAVAINERVSARLNDSLITPNASYDPREALTVMTIEARNELAFRNLIRPSVRNVMDNLTYEFAVFHAQKQANISNLSSVLAISPQTFAWPIRYRINNIRPFMAPAASAATFVGLIYLTIVTFFIVITANNARESTGYNTTLTMRSLIAVRIFTCFIAYFFLSLGYSLVNLAFQLDFTHRFGDGGFMIFWMLNWNSMVAIGLAIEALLPLLTMRFLPFFLVLWIISNLAVCIYPISILPSIFRYGYASPFYNAAKATRTIVFSTKNRLALNFGILISWAIISCITLALVQHIVRWREIRDMRNAPRAVEQSEQKGQRRSV
ncbi:hypothetical protein AMATHDRAFT_69895 [Amanita thiersii Skay4041]|uniref:DUF3533 domain-containing protein n=1 Tax=Amanita thiersii Skay4041 TaxID=703135 RepID=A0A2A9NAR7_9AGAR|nr:hypothetical protein AMATHDRAFT_69895 [Amanita thiersii Skay4041]